MTVAALSVTGSLDHYPATTVPIASLLPADSPRLDGENPEHVRALAELDGNIPPIVVHRPTMRVIDGMHRLRAAVLRGRDTIEVRFFDGGERDVFILAVELNSEHGLPLSQQDRIAAATRVIGSHPHLSDRVIAELAGLSAKTVGAIRRRTHAEPAQLDGRIGRDGKVRPLNTAEGRRLAGRIMTERPDASLREIAQEAGISLGTVRDVRARLRRGEDAVPLRQRRAPSVDQGMGDCDDVSAAASHAVPELDPAVAVRMLQQLRRDPSLRFSQAGRSVLRLLDSHSIPTATWTELVDAMPMHCADALVEVARSCARSWLLFAEQIEHRKSKLMAEPV